MPWETKKYVKLMYIEGASKRTYTFSVLTGRISRHFNKIGDVLRFVFYLVEVSHMILVYGLFLSVFSLRIL